MMALGLGLGLPFGGNAAGGADPSIVALNFGSRTRVGWGGHPMGYVGAGTLLITAGNSSAHWQINTLNHLVPKNGAGAYESAPPTFSGPYSLTVTDGIGWTRTVNVTILAGDMTVAPNDPVQSNSYQLNLAVADKTYSLKGQTLWLRDGNYNTGSGVLDFAPWDASQYSGSGRITVRSETVDASVDANGYKNRRHGAKVAVMKLTPQSGGAGPFDFKDIHFYNAVARGSLTSLFIFNTGSNAASGVTFDNCGWENSAAQTDLELSNCGGLTGKSDNMSVTNSTFYRVGFGLIVSGQAITGTDNVFHYIRDADCYQMGDGAFNYTIKRNVAFDILPVAGGHCDFLQLTLQSGGGTGALGEITDNIIYGTQSQGIYITGLGLGPYTSGLIENNIVHTSAGNGILVESATNVTVQHNTVVTWDFSANSNIKIENGTNVTEVHNLANGYDTTGMSGAVSLTPNPQTTISAGANLAGLTANLVAAFPGYVHPSVATDFSIAALKGYFTPGSVWFAANNNAGALDTTGARNAA